MFVFIGFSGSGMSAGTDTTSSFSGVESCLEKFTQHHSTISELFSTRKLKLDLCLQLRLFERDALEVTSELEVLCGDLRRSECDFDFHTVEHELQLHNDTIHQIQNSTFSIMQRGQELFQVGKQVTIDTLLL